ncbi:PQQ-binding-like beta-propeller repeat protein [Promicromonospora vindobonensis]|uniref:PQQ-binding-like beta-propeller repeat protein n=1 Tax=Promicromonospora vindobonensis TaxID=195748 RepID=A0ABW5VRB0_9MICO
MSRPDEQKSVVFDLVEGGGQDAAAEAADGPADDVGTGTGRRSWLPNVSRRTWLVAAAAVVAALVAVTAVDLVQDHQRAELMRASSVGVASLAEPPTETWTVPYDVPVGQGQDVSLGQQVVTMDGLVVVPPADAQDFWIDASTGMANQRPAGFEDVVAIDPGSGEVAWRVPVDERPACGPSGFDASASTDTLVCVHGPDDAREVLAIAPDGTARARPADLAAGEQVFAGPDGMVVRTVRTGEPVGTVECDSLGQCLPESLTEARDLLVTAEDAGTGRERWTSTVEFDQINTNNCQAVPEDGDWSTTASAVDPDLVTVRAGAETVVVDGCGVSATFSPIGVRLDLVGAVPPPVWVDELGSGRYALDRNGMATVVVNAAGEVLRTLDGSLRTESTSPDAPDDIVFVTRQSGTGFEAVREDGAVAWAETYAQGVLLVGREVVVVDRGIRLVGLDRETGAELWTSSTEDLVAMARLRTLTDGETVATHYLPNEGAGPGLLIALDLSTGERLWDVPMTGSAVAVDGHLVEFTRDGLRGLG